jgi:site-specific recombinase XerC
MNQRLPVVFTKQEAKEVLIRLAETKWLMASLFNGSGLRLRECLRLYVKDVGLEYNQIVVRDGKGKGGKEVPILSSCSCR